jgi:hypothetical protein
MNSEILHGEILAHLPDADVRTDQSADCVRIYWRKRAAFITPDKDGWLMIRILLPAETDYLQSPAIVDFGMDDKDASHKLAYWFKRLESTGFDLPISN